jgi:hypothetical protein
MQGETSQVLVIELQQEATLKGPSNEFARVWKVRRVGEAWRGAGFEFHRVTELGLDCRFAWH